jgi:hypothetical protein
MPAAAGVGKVRLELSNQTWKLEFSNGRTVRERNSARDGAARLLEHP